MNTFPGIVACTIFVSMTSARYLFRNEFVPVHHAPYVVSPFIDYPIYSDVDVDWVPYRTFDTSSYKGYEYPTYASAKHEVSYRSPYLPPPPFAHHKETRYYHTGFSFRYEVYNWFTKGRGQKRNVSPQAPGIPLVMSLNRPSFSLYSSLIGFRNSVLPTYQRYEYDNLSSYKGKHGINPTSINPVPKGKFNFMTPAISSGIDPKANVVPIASPLQESKNLPAWYTQPDSWMWPQGHKSGPLFGVKRSRKSVDAALEEAKFMKEA